jgi:hypothetical protein
MNIENDNIMTEDIEEDNVDVQRVLDECHMFISLINGDYNTRVVGAVTN